MESTIGFPKTLSLFLTPYCNLQCNFCYVNAIPIAMPKSTIRIYSMKEWTPIITEARKYGYTTLHLFGGEPFLYPELRPLCELAVDLGYEIMIATNGISFYESDQQWLTKIHHALNISITFNEIQLPWIQQNSTKRKWIRIFEENGIPYTITTCLTQLNADFYEVFMQNVLKEYSANFFGIFFSPIGRAEFHEEWSVDPGKWIQLIENLTNKYPVRIEQSYGEHIVNENSDECPMYSGQMLTILYNGEIYPCMLLMNQKQWQLGTLSLNYSLKDGLEKLYASYKKISACPAYWKTNKTDFRRKYITENPDKFTLLCPFRSY